MELAEGNSFFIIDCDNIYYLYSTGSLSKGTYMGSYREKTSLASIPMDVFRIAFCCSWNSALEFRKIYQIKHGVGSLDRCFGGYNSRIRTSYDFCHDVCRGIHSVFGIINQFHRSRRTWNASFVILHGKGLNFNKNI